MYHFTSLLRTISANDDGSYASRSAQDGPRQKAFLDTQHKQSWKPQEDGRAARLRLPDRRANLYPPTPGTNLFGSLPSTIIEPPTSYFSNNETRQPKISSISSSSSVQNFRRDPSLSPASVFGRHSSYGLPTPSAIDHLMHPGPLFLPEPHPVPAVMPSNTSTPSPSHSGLPTSSPSGADDSMHLPLSQLDQLPAPSPTAPSHLDLQTPNAATFTQPILRSDPSDPLHHVLPHPDPALIPSAPSHPTLQTQAPLTRIPSNPSESTHRASLHLDSAPTPITSAPSHPDLQTPAASTRLLPTDDLSHLPFHHQGSFSTPAPSISVLNQPESSTSVPSHTFTAVPLQPIVPPHPSASHASTSHSVSRIVSRPLSSFLGTRPDWQMEVHGEIVEIPAAYVDHESEQRGSLFNTAGCQIFYDLISSSLVPLTEPQRDPADIRRQAIQFLSCFSHPTASWHINASNLSPTQRDAIYGRTQNSKHPRAASRFLRFRFPFVYFEWHVKTCYSTLIRGLQCGGTEKDRTMSFSWTALVERGPSLGIVARGTCNDELVLDIHGYPLIAKRLFEITEVFQPELMIPIPYQIGPPDHPRNDDLMVFTTSQTVILFLRSGYRKMTFLIALSALFASLQPVVDKYNTAAGFVFAGIGILAAIISLLALIVEWVLGMAEARRARYRQ